MGDEIEDAKTKLKSLLGKLTANVDAMDLVNVQILLGKLINLQPELPPEVWPEDWQQDDEDEQVDENASSPRPK